MTPVHLLSLGAGVQSSTLALMAAAGEIAPMPTAAIFADTQAEPASVYAWLNWLEAQLPFPLYRVSKGNLAKDGLEMRVTKDGRTYCRSTLPYHTKSADGAAGMIRQRSCTRDYKVAPIMKLARELGGIKRGQKTVGVVQWIGISLDEVYRMKPSREAWAESRWPLIERKMSRHDCKLWIKAHGYPEPPRSACVFCPFHNNDEWRRLRDEEPDAFAAAVEFERQVQATRASSENFDSTPFLHRSLVPLDEVDLSTDVDRGQLLLWNNECEGMCGV